jgi:lipoprotein-releasing system ATP-binding protein
VQADLERIVQTTRVIQEEVRLRVVDLRKSFSTPTTERIEVLRGVGLDVRPGETVAITGASGSGKSTLLHLLGGLDSADHGSITFETTEITELRNNAMAQFRQQHLGFVFQFHYLMPDLSAVENVTLPLLINRQGTGEAHRRAKVLLAEFGLSDRMDYPISHLSGGEQQRVAFARALVNSPSLVLADEPTGNLDDLFADEIGKTLINYVRSHRSIGIIATHSKNLAGLCDRVLLLQDGRLHST